MNKKYELEEIYKIILPQLNEKQRRLYVAVESLRLGYGGISKVARASGISRVTISSGIKEINFGVTDNGRIRKQGGDSKKITSKQPEIVEEIIKLANPKGNPENPIRWTSHSLKKISTALKAKGYIISPMSVQRILKTNGFALKSNKKNIESKSNHIDRDAQFIYMNQIATDCIKKANPVISIDCKKKELVGNFKNNGKEWIEKNTNVVVNVYDFLSLADGKVAPYGIYDMLHNKGFVNVGIVHDTAEFSVESIRRWWNNFGLIEYPKATSIMITPEFRKRVTKH